MTDIWAVIPAAGAGRRFGGDCPKQYLSLLGRPVLEWSLAAVLAHPRMRGAIVAVSPGDDRARSIRAPAGRELQFCEGGQERCESVLRALESLLARGADPDDWALVHDAARPCLSAVELNALLAETVEQGEGGLLAVPVRDTLKQADGQLVAGTIPRSGLWQALTPQVFPLGQLEDALRRACSDGAAVTDEAQAMERVGLRPRLVEGSPENIKLTRPADLPLVEAILSSRHPAAPAQVRA